jgi:hypothetical protein
MYLTPKDLLSARPQQLQTYMQRGLITQEDAARALAYKARMAEGRKAGKAAKGKPKTIVDEIAEAVKSKIESEPSPESMSGVGLLPVGDLNYSDGGIVAFEKGGDVPPPSYGSKDWLAKEMDRIQKAKKDLGSVEPMTPEEQSALYSKEYGEAQGRMEPFLKRLRDLEQQNKPDIAKLEADAASNARLKGFASLMGARGRGVGGLLAAMGGATNVGLDQYERGMASVKEANKSHFESQKLLARAEMESAKGNHEAARRLVEAANVAKKNEISENRNAVRDLSREQERAEDVYGTTAKSEAQAAATAQREEESRRRFEAMMAKIDATTKMALARSGGGGGGGGGGGKSDAATYKLIEGTVARLYMNNGFMEAATAEAQRSAKAAGIDRKSPEYGAHVEKEVAARVARAAKDIAVNIPSSMLDKLPPSIKPTTPVTPTAPVPTAPTPGRMRVDALGNPL